ncbi:hypothetical protein QR680_009133 [Steinernema hermaphroditum]|uniref:Decapping nuclease n=1 Tax=Steinernema hermaphroditum TaxID=289476 RepID=A0AA39IJ60_9BILA|nr:hypothetical protein QR680_009133 [Steinernema hermaphroditum]
MNPYPFNDPRREDVERLREELLRAREKVRRNEETIQNLGILLATKASQPPAQPPSYHTYYAPHRPLPPRVPSGIGTQNASWMSSQTFLPYSRAPDLGLPSVPPLQSESSRAPPVAPPEGIIKLDPSSLHPTTIGIRNLRLYGEFSCRDGNSFLRPTQAKRQLKRAPPALPTDLMRGIDDYFFAEEKNERFDLLLRWITENTEIGENLSESVDQSDFVCLRGTLVRFAEHIYLSKNKMRSIQIAATKVKDVIFLFEHTWYHTESRKSSTYQKLRCTEVVCDYEDTNDHDLSDEYFVVLTADFGPKTKLEEHKPLRVLYAAKVDLVDGEERCSVKMSSKAASNPNAQLQGSLMAPSSIIECRVDNGQLISYNKVPLDSSTAVVKDSAKWIYKLLREVKERMDREPEGTLMMIEREDDQFKINKSDDQSRRFMSKSFLRKFS